MRRALASTEKLGSLVALSFAALACAACAGGPQGEPPTQGKRPNFVIVISDDHRWDAIGVAGRSGVLTPVIDAMAREGVYLRQAITSVSQCHPVRATLLTGLPAFRHGVYSTKHLEPDAALTLCKRPTLPSLLRQNGYRTALVGKWHLPAPPLDCGFEIVRTWLPEGGTGYREPELVDGEGGSHHAVPGFTQEILADDAVDFLHSETASSSPFLLWVAFTAPHFPYQPNPERIAALYAKSDSERLRPLDFPRDVAANDWLHYSEAVSHLDEQFGRVLDALRDTGLDDRTIVVFLGDNGHMMGERGLGGPEARSNVKQVPYEASLRVPFVMRGPGLPRAAVSELAVSSLDLPPTLLALAGVAAPPEWPGRDIAGALAGRIEIRESFAEWSDEESAEFRELAFRAVRTPTRKLIVWKEPSKPDEFYDLVADPSESSNRAIDPAQREELEELRRRLLAWMVRNDDPAIDWVER